MRRHKPNEGEEIIISKVTKSKEITVKQEQFDHNPNSPTEQQRPRNRIIRKNTNNESMETPSKPTSQGHKTSQTSQKKQISNLPEQIAKIQKQNEELTIMALSEEIRQSLKKVQRFDRFIYAKQTEKTCFEPLKLEIKRLERIKNINKNMRSSVYDNQLTVTALYNYIKFIHELNEENVQLKDFKEKQQKQIAKKKQEEFQAALQAKKNRGSQGNSRNQRLEEQKKRLAELIDANIKQKQYMKVNKEIQQFIKKFGKDETSAENIHFYESIYELSSDNQEMENIMKEIADILQTLGTANLQEVDGCIRSLNGNHTAFKQFNNKYRNHDRFHGKQMINILHNIEKFNDNIVKYLEEKKKVEKVRGNSLEVSRSITKEKESEIGEQKKKYDELKKKHAHMQVQLDKAKFKLNELQGIKSEYQKEEKVMKNFENRMNTIVDKLRRKTEWHHQFELLKKDKEFIAEKPYSIFFNFEEALTHFNEAKRSKSADRIDQVLDEIQNLFHKTTMHHQEKFKQVSRLIQNTKKKNIYSVELLNKVNYLLISVMEYMKDEAEKMIIKEKNEHRKSLEHQKSHEKQQINKLRKQLTVMHQSEVRKSRSVIKENKEMRSLMNKIDEFIEAKDFGKIKKNIDTFLKKYRNEGYDKDKIHVYEVLDELLLNNTEMESIMKEIAQILETLGTADLRQVDPCIRSLKGNHNKFKYISNKYRNHEKFHGKQMINILHNIEKFNDDMVKYLEEKKKVDKVRGNSLEVSRSMEQVKNSEIGEQKKKYDELKRTNALMEVELEKTKFKLHQLEGVKSEYQKEEKVMKNFENRMNKIVDKMRKKIEWRHDYDLLRKDKDFIAEKPYSLFFNFEEGMAHYEDSEQSKEIQKMDKVFENIQRIFKNSNLTFDKRFAQVSRTIENSAKSNIHMLQLLKKIDYLLITIVKSVRSEAGQKTANSLESSRVKMQNQLSQSKKKLSQLARTPPKVPKSNDQQKKIEQLQARLKQIEEQKSSIEAQLKEKNEKIKHYELFENKFSTIVDKMPKNANWGKDINNLQNDDKFKELKTVDNVRKMIQHLEGVRQTQFNKQAEKLENMILSVSKIFDKKIPVNKQKAELQRTLSLAARSDRQNEPYGNKLKQLIFKILQTIQPVQAPQTPSKNRQEQKEKQQKIHLLSTQNKKLIQSVEAQRSASKELKEKLLSAEKIKNQKLSRLNSLEKKSDEIQKVREELSKSKEEKRKLETTVSSLEKKSAEIQKVREELSKSKEEKKKLETSLQQMKKQSRQLNQQRSKKNKAEESFETDLGSYTTTIRSLVNQRNYQKIDVEINKIFRKYQNNRSMTTLLQVWKNLIGDYASLNEQVQKAQSEPKEPNYTILLKMIQRANSQIKRPSRDRKQWSKFFEKEVSKNKQLQQLVDLLATLNENIYQKGQNFEEISQKNKQNTSTLKSIMETLRDIERQANKKQFLQREDTWSRVVDVNHNDPIFQQLLRVLISISRISISRITEEKDRSSKSSHKIDEQMLKLNNIISQLQRKILDKQEEIQSLSKQLNQYHKKAQQEAPPLDRSSIKSGRKSFRGRTPEKERNQLENYKTKIQQYASEEKLLLSRIQSLQREIESQKRDNRQKSQLIRSLQTYKHKSIGLQSSLHEQSRKYELNARSQEEKFYTQLKKLSQSREQALREHHIQFQRTKKQLNEEIDNLRHKLAQHQRNSHTIQQFETLKSKFHDKQQQLIKISQERDQIITDQVLKALQNQQNDFNAFLEKRERQIQSEVKSNYQTIIQKTHIELQTHNKEITSKMEKTKETQIVELKAYYERKVRQLERSEEEARNQLQKIKFDNQSLNSQFTLRVNQLESAKAFAKESESSKFKELTDMRNFYESRIRELSQNQSNLQSQANGLKLQNQSLNYKLNSKTQQIEHLQRQCKSRISETTDQLNRKLTQAITQHEISINKANSSYDITAKQLAQLKNRYEDLSHKSREQERSHKQEVQRLMLSISEEKKFWENKLRENNENYEAKIKNLQYRLDDSEQYREKYANLHSKHEQLILKVEEQAVSIRSYESRVISQPQINTSVPHISPQLQQLSSRLQSYQTHLQSSLSHNQCQNQYRKLQDQYYSLIKENSNKIESLKSEHYNSLEQLREKNNEMRMEIKEKEFLLDNEKERVEKHKREIQQQHEELRKLKDNFSNLQRERQISDRQVYELKAQLQAIKKIKENDRMRESQVISIREHKDHRQPELRLTNNRVIQLQATITNRNLQIRQLQQMIDRKKKEIDDEREKVHNLQRQITIIKQANFKAQSRISNLESNNYHLQTQLKSFEIKNQALTKEVNATNGQIHEYQLKITDLQNKESMIRHDFIRVKTESEVEHNHMQDRETKNLREEILSLKNQIKRINEAKYERHHDYIERDKLKIEEMIHTRQIHRNHNSQNYDQSELEVLRRINMEVSELVKTNRSLHTKCILLESESMFSHQTLEQINYFSNLQAVLDSLVNFLIDNSLIHSSEAYQKFLNAIQRTLQDGDFSVYFQHLENFLKAQFMTVNDLKEEEIQRKGEQLQQIKEQMQDMIEKQIEYNQDEDYGALQKYKMIFTDVKYLLREYIRLKDPEYLNMICRSLGIDNK